MPKGEAEKEDHCRARREEKRNCDPQGTPRALNREGNKQQGGLQNTTCYPIFITALLPDEKTIRSSQVSTCSFLFNTLNSLWNLPHHSTVHTDTLRWNPSGFHIHSLGGRTQREPLHLSGHLLWEPRCLMSKHMTREAEWDPSAGNCLQQPNI